MRKGKTELIVTMVFVMTLFTIIGNVLAAVGRWTLSTV